MDDCETSEDGKSVSVEREGSWPRGRGDCKSTCVFGVRDVMFLDGNETTLGVDFERKLKYLLRLESRAQAQAASAEAIRV